MVLLHASADGAICAPPVLLKQLRGVAWRGSVWGRQRVKSSVAQQVTGSGRWLQGTVGCSFPKAETACNKEASPVCMPCSLSHRSIVTHRYVWVCLDATHVEEHGDGLDCNVGAVDHKVLATGGLRYLQRHDNDGVVAAEVGAGHLQALTCRAGGRRKGTGCVVGGSGACCR